MTEWILLIATAAAMLVSVFYLGFACGISRMIR